MFSLVYRSVAKPGFGLYQIQQMLENAQINNYRNNITGCLLYHEGHFIQYLEGNQIRVLNLYDQIKEDNRHHKVELLSHGEREKREFDSWDMAYENFYGENEQITHLKLMVTAYLKNKGQNLQYHPAKVAFWEEVGKLFQGKRTLG